MRIIATLENGIVTFGHVVDDHTYVVRGRQSDLQRIASALVEQIRDYPPQLRQMIAMAWTTFKVKVWC